MLVVASGHQGPKKLQLLGQSSQTPNMKSYVRLFQRIPVRGHCVRNSTDSSKRILISSELTEICQFMYFWHFLNTNFKVKKLKSNFPTHMPKSDLCADPRTHMANWNFVTYALWPHFLGQGQGHGHPSDIFVLSRSSHQNTHARTIPLSESYV